MAKKDLRHQLQIIFNTGHINYDNYIQKEVVIDGVEYAAVINRFGITNKTTGKLIDDEMLDTLLTRYSGDGSDLLEFVVSESL